MLKTYPTRQVIKPSNASMKQSKERKASVRMVLVDPPCTDGTNAPIEDRMHDSLVTYIQMCGGFTRQKAMEILLYCVGYRLVIICGSDKEDSSLIVSKLSLYRTPYLPPQDLNRYQEYLRSHFESGNTPKVNGLQ